MIWGKAIKIVFVSWSILLQQRLCAADNVEKIKNLISQCLTITYGLEQRSAECILEKCLPLIENNQHHDILKEFVVLSITHVPTARSRARESEDRAWYDPVVTAPLFHE